MTYAIGTLTTIGTLTDPVTRAQLAIAARKYQQAHDAGDIQRERAHAGRLHYLLACIWRRYQHGTTEGADRVMALISADTLARMLTTRAQLAEGI